MNAVIENNFRYHSPIGRTELHLALREKAKELALLINDTLPDGREKSTAVTKVEEAMFWACAGLVREIPNHG